MLAQLEDGKDHQVRPMGNNDKQTTTADSMYRSSFPDNFLASDRVDLFSIGRGIFQSQESAYTSSESIDEQYIVDLKKGFTPSDRQDLIKEIRMRSQGYQAAYYAEGGEV